MNILLIILLVILICFIYAYNKGIQLRNYVREAFSTMDVYLKKRWDLLPNLIAIVKDYKEYEKNVLERITQIRTQNYAQMSNTEKINTNIDLDNSLSKIMLVAENYPDLKANEAYIKLMDQLNSIENDIANSRKYYNGTVRELNNFLEVFPTNIIGSIAGIKQEKMFEISSEERENVKV